MKRPRRDEFNRKEWFTVVGFDENNVKMIEVGPLDSPEAADSERAQMRKVHPNLMFYIALNRIDKSVQYELPLSYQYGRRP